MDKISRRRFAGAAGAALAAGLAPSWTPANAAVERDFEALRHGGRLPRPNLLVILADDLGWADLSAYGAPTIRTPNLDALAASGVRFTNAYSASSVCSPTRFGLYTGRYPARLPGGLPEPIGAPNPQHGIPLDHPTLASLLKQQGYDTALIGKWHCGYLPWFSPTRLGWDEFFGNFSGGLDYGRGRGRATRRSATRSPRGSRPVSRACCSTPTVARSTPTRRWSRTSTARSARC